MKRLLREPLVHFLLLGAVIFAAYWFVSRNREAPPQQIVLTQGRIESMVVTFSRTWHRPPTQGELQALIRDFVREEICAREAAAIGLDKDDTIIRRRLRQKLEFITEDLAAQVEPTDAQLQTYLSEHPQAFRTEPRFTFSQVYFNPQQRGENLSRDTAQLLVKLREAGAGADISALGDSRLLEAKFEGLPIGEIAKQFGEKFAGRLGELSIGQWQGPIESGFGVHLIVVSQRSEGRLPPFDAIRVSVRREWANAQRLAASDKFYEELSKRYTVSIEQPVPAKAGKVLAEARR